MILAIKLLIISLIIWGTLFLYPVLSSKNTKLMNEVNAVESQILMFNTSRVYDLIQKQVDIGPRYPGSVGIENTRISPYFINRAFDPNISSFKYYPERLSLKLSNSHSARGDLGCCPAVLEVSYS